MRVLSIFVVMMFFTSCDKLTLTKKQPLQPIDTIVDFSSVDTSPSFPGCDSIFDKVQKSKCFRKTIHQKIGKELLKHKLSIKDSIDEIVLVDLKITDEGKIIFEALEASEKAKEQLPELDSILKASVANLPNVFPAIKKRYKVTTKYQLPIRVLLKE